MGKVSENQKGTVRQMKKTLASVFGLLIVAGTAVFPGTMAAVPVHDAANTAENHATFLQTAQNTLNTATQIANQVTNLASLSPEAMAAHLLGIEEEFGDMVESMKQAQGVMKASQSAETAWNNSFRKADSFFEGDTSRVDNFGDSKKMIRTLDQTYLDALRASKSSAKIEKDAKRLQAMMEQNKSAAGNKQALQIQNNLSAQQVTLQMKRNQTLGMFSSAVVAHLNQINQEKAYATSINQKYVESSKKTIAEYPELKKRLGM